MTTAERYDVVVVGAGPAGSLAARAAASGGARTLLVDQRAELGQPVQCGEFLPAPEELADIFPFPDVIRAAYEIPSGSVLRETNSMSCIAPGGRRYRFPLRGFSVARRSFDKALALHAEGAGAELRFPSGVTRVRGGSVTMASGAAIEAKVVVGADGPLSTVARGAGFAPARQLYRMITASSVGEFPPEIDLFFGSVAPGGYAWTIPKAGAANVGLGVTRLSRGATLGRLLDRFVRSLGLPPAEDPTCWWVPIGAPPGSAVRGCALFVGDAANLVMATNGGGIPTAMISGWDAGQVAAEHVREGVPLAEYDRRWKEHLFRPLARGHRLKRLGDRVASTDALLDFGMRYIGASGLDAMMRLRWPGRLGGNS
ncbi:MAG: NAD(P)/FAD-dependent oxidoreductase [Thermoplasmata archaeon]|nr:NAD(P)/FAD-dependent oxidoreductase [Thermoplasmata archaeon]MCI4359008.1 NAD(P)/FAD-dependent oxidoreductase [Thermoplasmata archaeon]